MSKDQCIEILRLLSLSLPNFNYRDNEVINLWHNIFKDYDYKDVRSKVNECLEEDRFQFNAPTPQFIVRNLQRLEEKKKLNSYKVYCQNCGRLFDSYEEEEKHFDRCMSVDYVITNTKKWFNKELDKKELFNMNDDDFKIRYMKLLAYIYKNTDNEKEKDIIGKILNVGDDK